METKKELRKLMNDALLNLDFEIKKKYDKLIFEKIINHEVVKNSKTIAIYHSTTEEANTQALIYKFLHSGKEVCIPRVEGDIMTMRLIDNISFPYDKFFGIRQPNKDSTIVLPEDIDLLIIPGLAFDSQKNRLGQGGGYYDKYLANFKNKTIMIAYNFQKIQKVPIENHDKQVDIIVTEKEVIE